MPIHPAISLDEFNSSLDAFNGSLDAFNGSLDVFNFFTRCV